MNVLCDYCGKPAEFVGGSVMYPHRPDLAHKKFWRCLPCEAWVGCHDRNPKLKLNGDEPLGRLANAELRKAKMEAHAAFDPLWKSGIFTRSGAYQWLAIVMGIERVDGVHIGKLDVAECKSVVAHASQYRTDLKKVGKK